MPLKSSLFTVALLLISNTMLFAQMQLKDRLELEGGVNYTLGVRSLENFRDNTSTNLGGFGYQIGANVHLWQMYSGNGLRNSIIVGISYGSTNFTLRDLSYADEGSILIGGTVIPGPVRSTLGQIEARSESFRTQFQLRHEISERWAAILGIQTLEVRGGEIRQNNRLTITHFYDQTRNVFLPLDTPQVVEQESVVRDANRIRLQLGAEYRGWLSGSFVKILVEFGGPNNNYLFSTTHLSLLAGHRL